MGPIFISASNYGRLIGYGRTTPAEPEICEQPKPIYRFLAVWSKIAPGTNHFSVGLLRPFHNVTTLCYDLGPQKSLGFTGIVTTLRPVTTSRRIIWIRGYPRLSAPIRGFTRPPFPTRLSSHVTASFHYSIIPTLQSPKSPAISTQLIVISTIDSPRGKSAPLKTRRNHLTCLTHLTHLTLLHASPGSSAG